MRIGRHLVIMLIVSMVSACQTTDVKEQTVGRLPISSADLERINRELSVGERIAEYEIDPEDGVKFSYQLAANRYGDARFAIFLNGKDSYQSSLQFWFDSTCGINQNARLVVRNGREMESLYFDEFATHTSPTNVSLSYNGKSKGRFSYTLKMNDVVKRLLLKNKVKSIDLEVFNGKVVLSALEEKV